MNLANSNSREPPPVGKGRRSFGLRASGLAVLWIVLLLPSDLTRAIWAAAPSTQRPAFVVAPNVSSTFAEQAREVYDQLPEVLRSNLARYGWQVRIVHSVVHDRPELRDQAPRGWPAGMRWSQVDAVHLPSERLLIFAEYRTTRRGQQVVNSRLAQVMYHELGHAADIFHGGRTFFYSGSFHFHQAYRRDLMRLDAEQRNQLAYFVQPSLAGPQEAFAEAVAIHLGGGSAIGKDDLFRAGFPTVLQTVNRLLSSLED